MADYGKRHYHQHTYVLTNPQGDRPAPHRRGHWQSAWNTFNANTAYYQRQKPGVSAQFIIGKNGTIYQLMPLTYRARHCIGMNRKSRSASSSCQESAGHSGHWMDRQILGRTRQVNAAAVKLVR